MTKKRRRRWASWPAAQRVTSAAGLGCALLLSVLILYLNRDFYHDDAYITLRYARNFIEGSGLVWNPGEYVQGYSNFLHLILVSILGALGIDLVSASRIVGVAALAGLGGVVLVFGASAEAGRGSPLWHLPAILVLTSAPMLVWSVGGLEGTLFSFLVAAGCLLFVAAMDSPNRSWLYAASGACLGLSYLARPDGVVFIAISAVVLLAMRKEEPRAHLDLISFVASAAAVVVPYAVWQLLYYGDVVPNTFYAKAEGFSWRRLHSGLRYVMAYALRPPFLPLLVVASLVYAFARRAWSPKLTYLTLSVSAYVMFVVFVGGDHMQAFRFLLPVVALMGCMLAMALAPSIQQFGWPATAAITVAILVLSSVQLPDRTLNPQSEDQAALVGTIVGNYISNAWPEGSLVALNTAGSTPYYAGQHRYVDMLGLNDPHIAKRHIEKVELPWQTVPGHLKGDGAYVLSRRPDYIIVGPAHGTVASMPWFLSDLELARDRGFEQDYDLFQVALDHSGRPVEDGDVIFRYYQRTNGPAVPTPSSVDIAELP